MLATFIQSLCAIIGVFTLIEGLTEATDKQGGGGLIIIALVCFAVVILLSGGKRKGRPPDGN